MGREIRAFGRDQGRRLFGQDPAGYAAGRPPYPDRVYELLATRCGLGPGTVVAEIGPATGLVTAELLARGASVTGVEPSEPLSSYLRETHGGPSLEVVTAPFEESGLPARSVDLVAAATSYHWVEPEAGAAELRRVLRPGGHVALWWMMFEDPARPREFDVAAEQILGLVPGTVMAPGKPPFQLDVAAHHTYLTEAGFTDVHSELIRTEVRMDAARLRALYSSMALVLNQPPGEREQTLDALVSLVQDRFGGEVVRPFVTAFYCARLH